MGRSSHISNRRRSRSRALQMLYACEVGDHSLKDVINDPIFNIKNDSESKRFCEKLVRLTLEHRIEFDEFIRSKTENWEFERIAMVDKLLIRIALCEILYFPEIPPKVTINEAIEISKDFSTTESGRFINGIIDAIYLDLKKEDRIIKSGRGLIDSSLKQ